MTMYSRTIPRDLFNESKLLKCMGQIALLIHDGRCKYPLRLEHDTDQYEGFQIEQNPADGSLYVTNLRLYFAETEITLATTYNSKQPYPLVFNDQDDVFNSGGQWSIEFMHFLMDLADTH